MEVVMWLRLALLFVVIGCSSPDPALPPDGDPPDAAGPPPPDAGPCAYLERRYGASDLVEERDVGYAVVTDAYGTHDLALDLMRPRDGGLRPAIVWMHGGFFRVGQRGDMSEYVLESASRGYVAATISYRLRASDNPQATYQEKLRAAQSDAQAAVRWLRANAAAYEIDPDRIVFGGFSAGGLSALALGYDYDTIGDADDNQANPGFSSRAQAIITLDSMNPNATMLPGDPPFAVFRATVTTGGEDEDVADAAQEMMIDLAESVGVAYRFTPVEGAAHADLDDPAFSPFIAAGAAGFLCDVLPR
jgi:acetyl esterase/lipase